MQQLDAHDAAFLYAETDNANANVTLIQIYDQTTGLLNWPFAAALSVILLVLFGTIIAVYQRFTRKIGA